MQDEQSTRPDALVREVYFPTLIYFRDLHETAAVRAELIGHIRSWRDQDPEGVVRSNVKQVGAWHSGLDMHRREEYAALTSQVLAAACEIFADLGYDPASEPALDNMWANINRKGAYNRSHIHPNVLWSGVYYVQAPPGCGRIYFADPRAQALTVTPQFAPARPRKIESWSEVYFEPVAGRLILFPGWLRHEVEPNLCDHEGTAGERISVSFNVIQRLRRIDRQ
jgi:uncharacterized protein (TIGR02466 family)